MCNYMVVLPLTQTYFMAMTQEAFVSRLRCGEPDTHLLRFRVHYLPHVLESHI